MQTEMIEMMEIECLIPHPFNQQVYGTPSNAVDFKEFVRSIRMYGVVEPLVITDDLVILNGHRRVAAAIDIGLKLIPVRKVKGLDEAAQINLIMILNQHRKRSLSMMVREALAIERLEQDSSTKKIMTDVLSDASNNHSHQMSEILATRVGFENRRAFEQAKKIVLSEQQSLIELMDKKSITVAYRKLHRQKNLSTYSSVIKPSDNWNFSPIHYPRIDTSQTHGYIPGDIYANCFWYFVKPGDLVVDPMAGSGMAMHIYHLRNQWMGTNVYDFNLLLFDLTPQTQEIKQHDLITEFPVSEADYIFIDLPYFGMVKGTYSDKEQDLANMSKKAYLKAVRRIAEVCATTQKVGKLCTVISPNYTDHRKPEIVNVSEYICDCWRSAGYKLYIETFSSRRIQKYQHPTMAKMNNLAKERRLPLTDITLIMTFKRVYS